MGQSCRTIPVRGTSDAFDRRHPLNFAVIPNNPMKKIILIFGATVILAVTAPAASVVFDTFGPGNTYAQFNLWDVNGSSTTNGLIETAAQFTAGTSGNLATVDLGLTYVNGPDPVDVFLYGDAGGSPDNANQTPLGTGTPTAAFGTSNNSVVSFSVAGSVPVTMGTTYWLILKPASSSTFDAWNVSSPFVPGNVAQSSDDSTWVAQIPVLPAFRLTATSTAGVPDSGSTILLMLGALVPLLVLQRKLIRRHASR